MLGDLRDACWLKRPAAAARPPAIYMGAVSRRGAAYPVAALPGRNRSGQSGWSSTGAPV